MKKIAFIGAGSYVFTRNLVRDMLTYPTLRDAQFALMDIDQERLSYITRSVNHLIEAGHSSATVLSTLSRQEALEGADGVVISVLPQDHHIFRRDLEIPMKYGVDLCVGDTRGPAAIFRLLRAVPALMDIARDIERYAPRALVLNYTNPMAMICRLFGRETSLNVTGLCHSVQGTAKMLSEWVGADPAKVTYTCAGINHQAFFLELKEDGQDLYPRLRQAVEKPEIYNHEIVRNEVFRHLGYYVTESSGHCSEYVSWFRKRPDLLEKYCMHGDSWNTGRHAFTIELRDKREATWRQEILDDLQKKDIDLSRGLEYAAGIFDTYFGGEAPYYEFNGNISNTGIIPNLPYGCCIESPVLVSKGRLRPLYVGNLPDHLAVLVNTSARCEELAVDGLIHRDREKIFQAILFDPLTCAVCSMQEIRDMVDEMFAANEEYLGYLH